MVVVHVGDGWVAVDGHDEAIKVEHNMATLAAW